MSQWNTDLTHEQMQRFEWNEADIEALQGQVASLEQRVATLEGGSGDDASQAWEAPPEGDEGTEGEAATTGSRKSRRSKEGEQ